MKDEIVKLEPTTPNQSNPPKKQGRRRKKKREREGQGGQPKPTSDLRFKACSIYYHRHEFFIFKVIIQGTCLIPCFTGC